jgi:hypothetical protein
VYDRSVAGVARPITVGVRLIAIGCQRTVVHVTTDAVGIGIIGRIVRTEVAYITLAIAVRVRLVGVRDEWTIVGAVVYAVPIGVG